MALEEISVDPSKPRRRTAVQEARAQRSDAAPREIVMERTGKLGFRIIASEEGDECTGVFVLELTGEKPRSAGLQVG